MSFLNDFKQKYFQSKNIWKIFGFYEMNKLVEIKLIFLTLNKRHVFQNQKKTTSSR